MLRTIVKTDKAPAAIGPYSQAVKAGGLVFTSGQIPLSIQGEIVAGGIEAQTKQVLTNMAAVLAEAGSSFELIVKNTVFLKDMEDFAAFNAVYAEAFQTNPPARSTFQVARLPKDALIEIESVAIVKS